MEQEIVIKPNYVFWDYFKINLYIIVNKISYYILIPISAIIIFLNIYWIVIGEKNVIEMFEFPFLVFLLLPFVIFLSVYRITKFSLSNKKLSEEINIIINQQFIDYKGETFNIKYNWTDFLKFKETKNWFLFYFNKRQAQVIRKKDLNENQLIELKELFNSLKIKKSLK